MMLSTLAFTTAEMEAIFMANVVMILLIARKCLD